jgi:Tol biopolymer transport system component
MTPDFQKLVLFDCHTKKWKDIVALQRIDHPSWTRDSRYVYFWGNTTVDSHGTGHPAIYRVEIRGRKLERVAPLDGIEIGQPSWFGVAPDGSPLAFRRVAVEEIYAFHLRR